VFLYDSSPIYGSYKKFRRGCRRRSFDAPIAGKITVYMCVKKCGAAGSIVGGKTTRCRHVLTDEKLKNVDSAFAANGTCLYHQHDLQQNCCIYIQKERQLWFLQFTTQFEARLNFANW